MIQANYELYKIAFKKKFNRPVFKFHSVINGLDVWLNLVDIEVFPFQEGDQIDIVTESFGLQGRKKYYMLIEGKKFSDFKVIYHGFSINSKSFLRNYAIKRNVKKGTFKGVSDWRDYMQSERDEYEPDYFNQKENLTNV